MADTEFPAPPGSAPLAALTERMGVKAAHVQDAPQREDASSDLICRYLPDTTLTYVNDAYCNQFGPRERLLGRSFLALLPASVREHARQHVASILQHPRIETWEHEVALADGSNGWQEWLDFVIVDGEGAVIGLQGIGRDITEQKRHERSLAAQYAVSRSLAKHREFERAVPEILETIATWLGFAFATLWVEDQAAGVLRNAGTLVLGDIPARALEEETRRCTFASGVGMPGRIWSNHRPLWRPNLATERAFGRQQQAAEAGLSVGLWYPVRGDGKILGVLELLGRSSSKLDAATQRMLQAVCLHIGHVIERNRVQRALRASEARCRALIERASDGIFVIDETGMIRYTSQSAGAILKYPPDVLTGMNGFSLVHPADLDTAQAFLKRVLERPRANPVVDVRARRADGSWCHVQVRAYDRRFDSSIEGVVINFRDVSDERASERALRQLSGRLLQLQDEERRRIARDLHDGTAQDLLALGLNLEHMRRQTTGNAEVERLVAESEALIQKASREVRTLSYVLHPPLLDESGLVAALRWFVDGFVRRSGIEVELVEERVIGRFSIDAELALFRVAQESLANVRRHSGSNRASIALTRDKSGIKLRVHDEGKTATTQRIRGEASTRAAVSSLGVGIPGMRERLRQLGGTLTVSMTRRGTRVTAWVPIQEIES